MQSFFSRNADDARNAALIFLGLGFGMLIACIMQQVLHVAAAPARHLPLARLAVIVMCWWWWRAVGWGGRGR